MAFLIGFGRRLVSQVPVPGALAGTDALAPLRISLAPAAAFAPEIPVYTREGEALGFNPPGVGRYRCRPGEIRITPCPQADDADVIGLLIATALPAVAWMEARFVLHAAAVVWPGREGSMAVAIAGASGSGKSMLAAALVERGAALLADDSVAIEIGDAGAIASGLPGGLHEWQGDRSRRAFRPLAPGRGVMAARLDAIVVLDPAGEHAPGRLDPVAAVTALLSHRHRPRVPAMLGRQAAVLAQATALAQRLPVFAWGRGHDSAAGQRPAVARFASQFGEPAARSGAALTTGQAVGQWGGC